MSFRSDVRDATAAVSLDLLKELGVQIVYSHRGAAGVTLWAAPDDESKTGGEMLDVDAELTSRVFFIPKQTNFPPTNGVSTEDTVTFESVLYHVRSIERDTVGAGYLLSCERVQARRLK